MGAGHIIVPEVRAARAVGAVGRLRGWLAGVFADPAAGDALLYAGSAVFALLVGVASGLRDYRQWGWLAAGPYGLGAAWSLWLARRRRSAGSGRPAVRAGLLAAVVAGVLLVPLLLEVAWQRACPGCGHQQSEVAVIAAAGRRLWAGAPAYLPGGGHPAGYFPYLPGMAVFGLPAAVWPGTGVGDPRLWFTAVTLAAAAAVVAGLPLGRRLRAGQLLAAAPSTTLPLVTGGDDLPVIALMLLAVVCVHRGRGLIGGVCAGAAAGLKLTAWPLLPLLLIGAHRGRWPRRRTTWLAVAAAGALLPVLLPSVLEDRSALVDNVLRFPLGAAAARSPAASPLPGHLLAGALGPGGHRLVLALLALALTAGLIVCVRRGLPRSPAQAAGVTAASLAIAIVLAPATRFGYLTYPLDLALAAWLLRPSHPPPTRAASATLAAADPPPALS